MAHTPRDIWWVGGSGAKVYDTAAYWSTSRNGAGGNGVATPDPSDTGIPQAGDTVHMVDGAPNITGSDQSAISLGAFYADFSPTTIPGVPPLTLGSSGAPLKLAVANNGTLKCTGSYGDLFLGMTLGGSGAMAAFNGSGNVTLQGTAASGAGTIVAGRGKLTIAADYIGSFNVRGTGGAIEIAYAASGTPTVVLDDGFALCNRTLGTSVVGKGALVLQGVAAISSVTVMPFARYRHNSTGTVAYIDARKDAVVEAGNVPFAVTNADVVGDYAPFGNPPQVTYTNVPRYFPGGFSE